MTPPADHSEEPFRAPATADEAQAVEPDSIEEHNGVQPVDTTRPAKVRIVQAEQRLAGLRSPDDAPPIPTLVPEEVESVPEHADVSLLQTRELVTTTPCIACGATQAQEQFAIASFSERLVTCVDCGLGSLHPFPDQRRVAGFYPAEYYGSVAAKFEYLVEAGVRFGAWSRIQSLRFHLEPGARVLDIGCGRGTTLRALLDMGYEAHGVELSEAATAGVDPRAQIRIAPDLAEAAYEAESFDAVVIWHVLEHLTNPEHTLAEVHRILRPGGRLILAVPNLQSWQAQWSGPAWFHLDLPRHLYHFSPQTLQSLLSGSGFDGVKIRHFALLQNPFGWLQSALNRWTDYPRNSLYSLLHKGTQHPDIKTMPRLARLALRLTFLFGLPVAVALSLTESLSRRGGTIAVTAKRM